MKTRFPAREWLGTKEAAAYLGVNRAFLDKHIKLLPPAYVIAGSRRYLVADLDAYIEAQRVKRPISA